MQQLLRRRGFALAVAIVLGAAVYQRPASAAPIPVTLVEQDGDWRLLRAGKPFTIKGAGGNHSLKALAAAGGNAIRTWAAQDIGDLLDKAHAHGLAVIVGIWLGHERHGFDYSNADQVSEQYERARQAILKYRDHPAVLMWAVGNEMEGFDQGNNAAVWLAVDAIAALVKKLDPHHPTLTVTAEIGGDRVENIHRLCPNIDVHGINSYGGVQSIPKRYREAGGTKPYVVTEFGPPGSWEMPKNDWNVPVELSSTAKASFYADGYRALESDEQLNLGSFAFLWSWKVEATATWFGMFLPTGEKLAAVDAMTEVWSGRLPKNKVPVIEKLAVKGSGRVKPGEVVEVSLSTYDPERAEPKVEWVLRAESERFNTGGDSIGMPPAIPDAVNGSTTGARVHLPEQPGAYRLYAYVRDGQGGAATANVPLSVEGNRPVFTKSGVRLPVVIYEDGPMPNGPWVPSGYMGEWEAITLDPSHSGDAKNGTHSLKVDLRSATGWGGVAWQDPPNDWGALPGGVDLSGASRLTFWAKGEKGGETVKFGLGLLGSDKRFSDTARLDTGDVTLGSKWRRFVIELADADLRRVKTGFYWVAAAPVTFYLDSLRVE